MKNFKAIIFDLDGTLVDSINDLANAMNHVLRTMNLPTHDTQQYKFFVGNGIRKLVERALPDTERTSGKIDLCYQKMICYYREHCFDCTTPYEGIPELLDFLRHERFRIYILSNKADELAKKIAEKLFPKNTFDIVCGALPTVPRKPDPTAAINIAKQTDTECREFLYIGDTNIDIATAKGAGMFAVGCTWGFRSRSELEAAHADLIIDHPRELITFLNEQK